MKNNKELYLQNPDKTLIEDTYRKLSTGSWFSLSCSIPKLAETLINLEVSGFIGIFINFPGLDDNIIDMFATKAKDGPCYDTGKSATYKGVALAALDDDNHLIYGQLKVCEKTALIYQLPQYKNLVTVSEGDLDLITRLTDEPVLFDCNTFEDDFANVLQLIENPELEPSKKICIFYPGPFKLLILKDGTLIRRGEAVTISIILAKDLIKNENCVEVPKGSPVLPVPPGSLKQKYEESGSGCLLDDLPISNIFQKIENIDFSILKTLNDGMKKRLTSLIENNRKYFILSGSNPNDPHGCCPSDDVGIVFELVDAGVLSAFNKPSPPDGCPLTFFAFSGEIEIENEKPVFSTNQEIRGKIMESIHKNNFQNN